MEKLLIILIFQIELRKYLMGNELVFHKANQVKKLEGDGFIAIVLYAIFNICVPQSLLVNVLVIYAIIFAITWSAVYTSDAHGKVLSVICLGVIEYCINKSFYPVLKLIEPLLSGLSGVDYWCLLLESLWGMLVVSVLGRKARKKRQEKKDILSPTTIVYLLVFVIVQMIGNIMAVRFTSQYIQHVELRQITELLSMASCINVCFLIWMLMYFRRQRETAEEELVLSEELRKMENSYYQTLLEKEEETRKFRHDVKNHLFCLNELISKGENDKVSDYIQNLSKEITKITKQRFYTHNDMFDAILHDKLKSLGNDITISVHGFFNGFGRMELYDFCMIFSNLLSNAVEELTLVKKNSKKGFLNIEIKCTKDLTDVRITNSAIGKKNFTREGLPKTGKHDKKNHGFGMRKVEQTIKKYQGVFQIESTEDTFEVIIKF